MHTQLKMKLSPGTLVPGARKYSVGNFSPSGLHVLVVDDDPLCLMVLERMLKQCSYKVTTCNRVNRALQLLRENRDKFDLVLSDVYMPDEDGFKLLEVIGLELDLPVIMMSANGETSVVMQGITHGACDYLIKPIRTEELRNIWQHVVRHNKSKELERSSSFQGELDEVSEGQESQDLTCKKRKEALEMEDCCMDAANSLKKARVNWSMELHGQFVDAVNKLGVDKAVPKRILEIMNVQGLTRENVASHLQKYRLYLKRLDGVFPEPCPIASFQASGDGKGGGTMKIHSAGKAPLPSGGVKGRNLGAGVGSGSGKDKRIDGGTLESLAKFRLHQQKMSANRAQVLGGLGLSDACSPEVAAGGGLQRMCSLDLSFLLQSQSIDCLTEQRSDAVDDLAACSFRSVKLEDDMETTASAVINNKRTYASRQALGRSDHIGRLSVVDHEKKCNRSEVVAGSGPTGRFYDSQSIESGSFSKTMDTMTQLMEGAPFNVGLTEEFGGEQGAVVGHDELLRGSNVRYMNCSVRPSLPKVPLASKDHAFPTVQLEQKGGGFFDPAAQSDSLADLGDLIDDAVSSTNVELSTESSTTDISGDAFSESSFGALAQLSEMISPNSHTSSLALPNVELNVSDYLHLDDGFGFQYTIDHHLGQ